MFWGQSFVVSISEGYLEEVDSQHDDYGALLIILLSETDGTFFYGLFVMNFAQRHEANQEQ